MWEAVVITSLGESSSECNSFSVSELMNGGCVRELAPFVSCLRLLALCMSCGTTSYLAWHKTSGTAHNPFKHVIG